jgi:amino acid adenylation domain-containing protein
MSDSVTGLEIAVIGLGGRFPGARSIDEFWENLKNGRESVSFFSDEELVHAGVDPGLLDHPDYVKTGGGILEESDYFDAPFFDYTPNEAVLMHPQIRLCHECAWEALESAGYDPYAYKGKIGLYAGASSSFNWESLMMLSGKADELGRFVAATLSNKDTLCTRVAYKLNLRGPAHTVQSACSTSLVAIDLACRGIWTGLCDMALAGGVTVWGSNKGGYLYKEGMIRSPDGHCRAFDAAARGMVSGEGIGLVVLKLLEDARSDGDTIQAVIKGSATNNDGFRKVGYTAPSVEGQAEVIRAALLMAEVDPTTITYMEAHGTGTALGDPVEIEALKQGFGTDQKGFCRIGSVKTNIGHLDSAAGVVGFIKTVLALKHRRIPASLHFQNPNPGIDFTDTPFVVNTALGEWENEGQPRRAGVSAFGVGGTNAHVILEEYRPDEARSAPRAPGRRLHHLVLLSARSEAALERMTVSLAQYLESHPQVVLADAAYTLQVGRKPFKYRRMLTGQTIDDVVEGLSSPDSGRVLSFQVEEENPRVIFMFPGQGAQYVNMALGLYNSEPLFQGELDRCFEILRPIMGVDVKEILFPPGQPSGAQIERTEVAQPLLFAVETALTKLLMTWGIKPQAMIGHSIGEYVAAHLAGVFSLEEALHIVRVRGELMGQMPGGDMVSVSMGPEELEPLLSGDVALAAVNTPTNCTISGPREAVFALTRQLENSGCQCRKLHTSHAFHSAMMAPIIDRFREEVAKIRLNRPQIPFISNLTGTWITLDEAVDPGYWASHLRHTVRFADGVRELLKNRHSIFIEAGPGRVLTTFVNAQPAENPALLALNLMRHPRQEVEDAQFLYQKIGQIWLAGKSVDWTSFHQGEGRYRIPLPTYPFEGRRFWIDTSDLKVDHTRLLKGWMPGRQKNLADWFYLPNWRRAEPPAARPGSPQERKRQTWLLFNDARGLGRLLGGRLEQQGQRVIVVTAGDDFIVSDQGHYTVNPDSPTDYQRLFAHLGAGEAIPRRILHLWSFHGSGPMAEEESAWPRFRANQGRGFYSLLFIARAIGRLTTESSSSAAFHIDVIADGWQDVGGDEQLAPAKSTLTGPLLVIPQEYPHIRCRGIDVVCPEPGHGDILPDQLLREIEAETIEEPLVAFRGIYRWLPCFDPLPLEAAPREQVPLRPSGVYLITGGLGKIGSMLALYLAREYQARLILIGRSALPADPDSEKAKRVRELEALGAEVLCLSGDAADEEWMQQVVAGAERRWGRIHGVIHAAGLIREADLALVDDLTVEACEQQFWPKVRGTIVLERLFRHKELDFCWLFSSLSTVLGGLRFAAYAAANAYMDAFVAQLRRRGRRNWCSIDWDGLSPSLTVDAFGRILARPALHRLVVSRGGELQRRLDQWVRLRSIGEEEISAEAAKTDRHPRPNLLNPYVPPATGMQRSLVEVWQRIFGYEKIGIRDDFLELGGDSLKAVTLVSLIHKTLQVKVSLTEIFSRQTIEALAAFMQDSTQEAARRIEAVEKREYYPLSSAQKRLYFLQQLEEANTTYNMPMALPLDRDMVKERLEETVKRLIDRHESLRTSFRMKGNEPVQRVHDRVEFVMEYYDTDGAVFVRPFDLSRAPLLRSGLLRLADEGFIWLVDIHHIVSDGTSQTILTEDFRALYRGTGLEPLRIQYKDFSRWQNLRFETGEIRSQEQYWLALYAGEIPRLNLPADHRRPEVFTFAGDCYTFRLGGEMVERFRALGAASGGTFYMNFLSVLNVLFFKYSGQTDIIIGSGLAGRTHADLLSVVGMFVNTLALRNYPAADQPYHAFLSEVIGRSVEAFENQDVQFEELVEQLDPDRDPSRNPLFDISMVVQNFQRPGEGPTQTQAQAPARKIPRYRQPISRFDMTFFVYEAADEVAISIEYYTGIFNRATIERLTANLQNVMRTVVRTPTICLKEVELITPEEKRDIQYTFNATHREFPRDRTIHALIEERVEEVPDCIAVVAGAVQHMSYRHLDEEANRLARYLSEAGGLTTEDRVGVWLSPSVYRPVAILAVLKAGCAYLPLDPGLPLARLKYIVNDAVIGLLIGEKGSVKQLNRLQWECEAFNRFLAIDSFDVNAEEEDEENELMDPELWHHVGETAVDDITGGGWQSSYTGLPFSRQEMDEYGDNILTKLTPLLHPRMRILEIGCASGISMYRLAPKVALYYGTDLSKVIIERNRQVVTQKGYTNIKLACLAAHEIQRIDESHFDLIIMNSVIQCFHGHNYLWKVIKQAIDLLTPRGSLFIGDVMDQDKKQDLVRELKTFKRKRERKRDSQHRHDDTTTKTDFSAELFVSKGFWQDLQAEVEAVAGVEISPKICTIENELTRFRYDVLLTIDKGSSPRQRIGKRKHQDDRRILERFDSRRVTPSGTSHQAAYLIYTSGTTGVPRGVIMQHRSLVNLCYWHNRTYRVSQGDRATLYAGFGFDASVWELFPYLLKGASLHVIPDAVRLDIEKLNAYYERCHITIGFLPTQFYEQFMERDNRSLRVLLTGGDRLHRFVRNRYDLYNNYGPTENTVVTTACRVQAAADNVPIGRPIDNTQILILDRDGRFLQPIGVPGELCIAGEGLARGYLNNPELTSEKFMNLAAKAREGTRSSKDEILTPKSQPLYRTGDLCRFLPDGNIEFLGRIDFQVKIRGFRIELSEIESQLLKHERIKEAVVIARQTETGDKTLSAYFTTHPTNETNETIPLKLQEYLSRTLPDYMIPAHFKELESIPLTPGGKVDRSALPTPEPETGEGHIAPRDRLEEQLAQIWGEILGVQKGSIGIDAGFFDLGGHSLKATTLCARIHRELNFKLPLAEIFVSPTIRRLSAYIRQAARDQYAPIRPVEKQQFYRLSSAQKRLYILQQMENESTVYNLPQFIPLDEEVDHSRLEAAFRQLIARHQSLRTSFIMVKDEPVQRVHEEVDFKIEYYKIAAKDAKGREIKNFVRPFDLSEAPLLRVGLMKEGRNTLMVDMHHIISDGTSQEILNREFDRIYQGETLAPLPLHYKDYACWQNHPEQQQQLKSQETYWLEEYGDDVPVLHLPLDYPRPPVQSFEGRTMGFAIPPHQAAGFYDLADREGATLYMVLLSLVYTLLARLSGQEDMVLGTVVAGRRRAELGNIVGMFVNTLALRNYPVADRTFREFLREVRQRTLSAFENQEYPFEELVEQLEVARDAGRNPLFDVMFTLQNMDQHDEAAPINTEGRDSAAKFDLTLFAAEVGQEVRLVVQYCSRLFKESTIQRFIDYFKNLARAVLKQPEQQIGDIDILSLEERRHILYGFNDTVTLYPRQQTIPQLFMGQVRRSPGRIALIGTPLSAADGGRRSRTHLSYDCLHTEATALACRLRQQGVGTDTIAAIQIERSTDMIIGIMGILKAGCAYLPIEPGNPADRIDYMLADSGASLVIKGRLDAGYTMGEKESQPARESSSSALAYCIYTSGTTGRPKGVLITHANVVRVVKDTNYLEIKAEDRLLQLSNYAFDGSVFDIYGALLNGAALVLVGEEEARDVDRLAALIRQEQVTVFLITTALFNTLVDLQIDSLSQVRHVLFGGERVSVQHTQRAREYLGRDRLIHMYGPTETTVYATYYPVADIEPGAATIPIGRPLANTSLYILDKSLNPVGLGISGELYIGGEGNARGYLNNPELTADRFVNFNLAAKTHEDTRSYKTGDLGRWLPDGSIEFLGRIDHQVKIRGFRIELAEIESQLHKHPQIKEAVVAARHSKTGDKTLSAYFTTNRTNKTSPAKLRQYLAETLPDYMIPAHFIEMARLPLTANGKVDRRQLPEPTLKAGEGYAPPGDPIESRLQAIWCELLSIEPAALGIDHHFFELGGHSLKATIMTARIYKEFAVKIPLLEMFKNPTIRKLAAYMRQKAGPTTVVIDDNLVLLKGKSDGADHLFLIHDGSGEVEGYLELCRHLNSRFNCWGIRVGLWQSYAPRCFSLPDLAEKYIHTIQAVQRVGPYRISGWSFGGMLAFEIVRQLEQMDEEVELFAMIDTSGPGENPLKPIEPFTIRSELDFVRDYLPVDIYEKLETATDLDRLWNLLVDSLEDKIEYVDLIKGVVAEYGGRGIPNVQHLNICEYIKYLNILRSCARAQALYRPRDKINTAIHYFQARGSKAAELDKWNNYSRQPVRFYKIKGDHYSILTLPGVIDLAARVGGIGNKLNKE